LVPSRELEEKRKAFVPPEADYTTKIGLCGSLVSRKKKKELFKSKQVKWKPEFKFGKSSVLTIPIERFLKPLLRKKSKFGWGRRVAFNKNFIAGKKFFKPPTAHKLMYGDL
jgi:hypothetical protein